MSSSELWMLTLEATREGGREVRARFRARSAKVAHRATRFLMEHGFSVDRSLGTGYVFLDTFSKESMTEDEVRDLIKDQGIELVSMSTDEGEAA